MQVGEIVYHWPLFAEEPEETVVLIEYDPDQFAELEEKPMRPMWKVITQRHSYPIWINERDLRQV
tara:strand:- start:18498 stop:18692 length:195 start_codon:yes stop_codon:yes gene_type:complete